MRNLTALALGVTLFLYFIVQTIWPGLLDNVLVDRVINFLIIGIMLYWYLRREQTSLVKNGVLVGFFGGAICALLIFLYIHVIHPTYFEEFAAFQANKLNSLGYDQYTITKMLSIIAAEKTYYYLEMSSIISTTLVSFAITLVLSPFVQRSWTNVQKDSLK